MLEMTAAQPMDVTSKPGITPGSTLVLVALVSFALLMLAPYARNGLWFDDAINSQAWAIVHRFETSVWQLSWAVSQVWIERAGRLLLVWPMLYGFFYATRDTLAIRLADLALLALHIGAVLWLLRRLGFTARRLGLYLLVLLALFQIRAGDDPIGAYASFCQVLGLLMTIALLLLERWWRSGATSMLLASIMVAALSLLMYELNLIYLPLAAVVILRAPYAGKARKLLLLALPFCAFVFASLVVKQRATQLYPGAALGDVAGILPTYLKQLVATLPGSFYALAGWEALRPAALAWRVATTPAFLAAGVLAVVCWALLLGRYQRVGQAHAASSSIGWGALGLLLMAPSLIAISARYQTGLSWGQAHLPVYYQYFALAALVAMALDQPRLRGALVWLAPVFGAYVAANLAMNQYQADWLDRAFREPRESFVSAAKAGLLREMRDGDAVELGPGVPVFVDGNLIFDSTGLRVAVPDEPATALYFSARIRTDGRCFLLDRDNAAPYQWRVRPACTRDPRAALNVISN